MGEAEERRARMALSCVVEPGHHKLPAELARHGAEGLWGLLTSTSLDSAWVMRARALELGRVEELAARHGVRFIVPGDDEWPEQLSSLATAEMVQDACGVPVGLWVRGRGHLARLADASVAIVGSRASTAYGDRVASDLAATLVAGGTSVLSGGAYGIDAAAHRGALAEGGSTVAVLAGGLDSFYPRAHESLLEQVAEHGLTVSEVPPGEHPTRRRFLTRNRLLAALTGGTVVVEAGVRSGARNTVTWANACGRPVMAVPGPVGSATSFTPHRLIREGEAVLVTNAAEVLEMVAPMGTHLVARPSQPRLLDLLEADQAAVYEALPSRGGRDTGDLALRAGLPLPRVLGILQDLADAGLAAAREDGGWGLGRVQDRPLPPGERRLNGPGGRPPQPPRPPA